jgi:type II restriction enzyme
MDIEMPTLSVASLISEIDLLDREQSYRYVGGRSHLRIGEIIKPEGGIVFDTIDGNGNVTRNRRIPAESLQTIANICNLKPNFPLQFDRVFSAGGNTRSALETMLAYTPQFFVCYPERVSSYSGKSRRDLRHLMWCPEEKHAAGTLVEKDFGKIITEQEIGLDFGSILIPQSQLGDEFDTIEAKRVHTQMQVAIIEIGIVLGCQTWIAVNDRATLVASQPLGNKPGVVRSIDDIPVLYTREAKEIATLIDCLWVTNQGRELVAVIEVEHSTGVTSGLTRMAKLREQIPSIDTMFVIVADHDMRAKVVHEANTPIFRALNAGFLSYTTMRELYGLIQKYPLTGAVDAKFVRAFIERVRVG